MLALSSSNCSDRLLTSSCVHQRNLQKKCLPVQLSLIVSRSTFGLGSLRQTEKIRRCVHSSWVNSPAPRSPNEICSGKRGI
ncbi:hypothetical protein EYF80_037032 [Liparis tanakae]|uniref:Uncharacterized protein n=1 Tax=Liparis tanakae TaxID=230148 RepID=A0A4Z2GGR0_9TELE|nr:hypothetical protein EYF80_037032 [Liparis tanakae]